MIRQPMRLRLGYPPTVNTYWRRAGSRIHITHKGRAYRESVISTVLIDRVVRGVADSEKPLTGALALNIHVCMPDRRRRDLDNVLKALLDALAHAGVYEDDSQIERLIVQKGPLDRPNGHVDVIVYHCEEE